MADYEEIKQAILTYLYRHGATKGISMAWAMDCPEYTGDSVWCTAIDMAKQGTIARTTISEYAVFSLREGAIH